MNSYFIVGESRHASKTILTKPGEIWTQNLTKCPFDLLLSNYLDHTVEEILIVDPHIKLDYQQHLLFLLLKFIKERCRQNVRERRSLAITLFTGAGQVGNLDRTEFWPIGLSNGDELSKIVYRRVFLKVEFDSQVKFRTQIGQFHDRSICIYKRATTQRPSYFTQIQMGKGLSILRTKTCNCPEQEKPFRDLAKQKYNNQFVFNQARKVYENYRGPYSLRHYTRCVQPLTSTTFGLEKTGGSVQEWVDVDGRILNAFRQYFENSDVGGFRGLEMFRLEKISGC